MTTQPPDYHEAHLIGGPLGHSTIILHTPVEAYRVPKVRQGSVPMDERISDRVGIYRRSFPLRYDPFTHRPIQGEPHRWIYEWTGWES